MYGVVEEICRFFNYSPKRQQELQEHIENLPVGTTSKKKFVNLCKTLCKTLWVAQIQAFEVFRDLFPALVTLEVISTAHSWSTESSKKSSSTIDLNYSVSVFNVFRSNMGWVTFH